MQNFNYNGRIIKASTKRQAIKQIIAYGSAAEVQYEDDDMAKALSPENYAKLNSNDLWNYYTSITVHKDGRKTIHYLVSESISDLCYRLLPSESRHYCSSVLFQERLVELVDKLFKSCVKSCGLKSDNAGASLDADGSSTLYVEGDFVIEDEDKDIPKLVRLNEMFYFNQNNEYDKNIASFVEDAIRKVSPSTSVKREPLPMAKVWGMLENAVDVNSEVEHIRDELTDTAKDAVEAVLAELGSKYESPSEQQRIKMLQFVYELVLDKVRASL